MEGLLAKEKAEETTGNRALRAIARSQARPASATVPDEGDGGGSSSPQMARPKLSLPTLTGLPRPAPRLPPVADIKRRRLRGRGDLDPPRPHRYLQALLALCPPRRPQPRQATDDAPRAPVAKPSADPAQVAARPSRSAMGAAHPTPAIPGGADSSLLGGASTLLSRILPRASRDSLEGIAGGVLAGADEPASQRDDSSPLLPGGGPMSCPPPYCSPEQLNAFLAAHGDVSSSCPSSASSLEEPIASFIQLFGGPVRSLTDERFSTDVRNQLQPTAPVAGLHSSFEDRHHRRQRVAASHAAAQASLAVNRALRQPSDARTPDADMPS